MGKKLKRIGALLLALLMAAGVFGARPAAAADTKLNKSTAKVDAYERMSLKIKSSYEGSYYYTNVQKLDERTGDYYYAYDLCEYEEKGGGKFSYVFFEGGTYRVTIHLYDENYYDHSASCTVTVRGVGPAKRNLVVIKDGEAAIETENASFERAEVTNESDWWWYNPYDGEIALDGNKVKGVKEGRVKLKVYYRTDKEGEQRSADITVYITDPVYTPVDGYRLAGHYEYLDLSGVCEYSGINVECDNDKVCCWKGDCLEILGAGKCNLTIVADGRKFTDTIEAYAPDISDDILLLKKKKSQKIKVTGLPGGIKVKYTSADKKIASVSSDGTVKGKSAGSTYITVKCGDLTSFVCFVTVSNGGIAYTAAKKAMGFIGAKYSQDKRMEEGYFDCSALVWRAYKAAGCDLAGEKKYAPTAANLAKALEADGRAIAYEYIDPSELKPGDLIFYSSSTNDRYMNIDHVAMYYAAGNVYGNSAYGYGYYYPDYADNAGVMVHATSPSVNMTNYSGYIPYRIVMICRPID